MNKKRSNNSRNTAAHSDRIVYTTNSGRHTSQNLRRDVPDPSPYINNPNAKTNASTVSRMSQRDYTRERKRRRRHRVIVAVVIVVAVLLLGGAGVAFAYYQSLNSALQEGVDDDLRDQLVATDPTGGDPFYVLLMGIDGSAEREASAQYAGDTFRSDSIMLCRIDPTEKKVALVSIHRDTLVDIEGYGQEKINAAHALGGPSLAVQTISTFAGVDIAHYAEINFDGFKDIVDALGGIEVNVPIEINDDKAGGHLDAGLQTLDGDQALILCRSRHTYDDYGDGDTYRAANQRLVIAAIAKKILDSDVGTIANTVSVLADYVTTDMSLDEIITVAMSLQGLNTSTDITSAMEPTTSEYINDVWYEIVDVDAWREMMTRVDAGLSPTEEDVDDEATGIKLASTGDGSTAESTDSITTTSTVKTGSISIRNGNGITGAATEAAEILEEMGYLNVDAGDADSYNYEQTIVVCREESQLDQAQAIADALGASVVEVNPGNFVFDTGFLVVLGADWAY